MPCNDLSGENMDKFHDRCEAGRILANYLKEYAANSKVIILALPRGGVPVAYEIAVALSVPLDVLIVRKLGLPGNEEYAVGALAAGGTVFFNNAVMQQLHINQSAIGQVIEKEQEELLRRERLYRGQRPFPNLKDKIVIIVDDGIATGATMRAAIKALRKTSPQSIIVATPVIAHSTYDEMAPLVEKIVCVLKPIDFCAVGLWYENFPQTSDAEVINLLKESIKAY